MAPSIDFNNPQPSQHGGMGATTYWGGVSFRMWAPYCNQAWVAGDFSGWQPTKLASEGNGNWSLDFPGAQAGQQYKFRIDNNGQSQWRSDPRARQMTNSAGNSLIVDPGNFQWWHDADFHMPPKNQQVVYELHIGTFQDFFGGHGTWQSAIDKLDHLANLGVNVVEVMPPAQFPGDYSWGYNPAEPFAPQSSYGSPNDMRQFVDECHRRGIAVVVDTVYNHFGPSDLDTALNDNIGPQNLFHGGEYFYPDQRADTPWDWSRPDYGRQEVRDYIADNARMWFSEYHVDGLRLDATYAIRGNDTGDDPNGWNVMKAVNAVAHSQPTPKLTIAEDGGGLDSITDPHGAGFDSQWDIDFANVIDGAVEKPDDASRDMNAVAGAIGRAFNGSASNRITFSESHDKVANGEQRIPSMVGGWDSGGYFAKKKSTLAAAIALTAPGIPMLFQGQEFLTPGSFSAEQPLDWSLEQKFPGIEQMYRDLIHLRRNFNNSTQGLTGNNTQVFHVDNNAKVIGFHRWDQGGAGDDTVVLANFSNTPLSNYTVGLPDSGNWKVRFNSDWNGYSPDFGNSASGDVQAQGGSYDGLPNHGNVTVGPYSVVILSKDRGS